VVVPVAIVVIESDNWILGLARQRIGLTRRSFHSTAVAQSRADATNGKSIVQMFLGGRDDETIREMQETNLRHDEMKLKH